MKTTLSLILLLQVGCILGAPAWEIEYDDCEVGPNLADGSCACVGPLTVFCRGYDFYRESPEAYRYGWVCAYHEGQDRRDVLLTYRWQYGQGWFLAEEASWPSECRGIHAVSGW
jgi:hypothetical protein